MNARRVAAFGPIRVELVLGSIIDVEADAVVNPSNTSLWLGAGVSGALREAAGPALQAAMLEQEPIEEVEFVVTPSFGHTKVREIIHVPTVSGSANIVRHAYMNALWVARNSSYRRLALPSLGTGIGSLSLETGAEQLKAALLVESSPEFAVELTVVMAFLGQEALETFARVLGAEEVAA